MSSLRGAKPTLDPCNHGCIPFSLMQVSWIQWGERHNKLKIWNRSWRRLWYGRCQMPGECPQKENQDMFSFKEYWCGFLFRVTKIRWLTVSMQATMTARPAKLPGLSVRIMVWWLICHWLSVGTLLCWCWCNCTSHAFYSFASEDDDTNDNGRCSIFAQRWWYT